MAETRRDDLTRAVLRSFFTLFISLSSFSCAVEEGQQRPASGAVVKSIALPPKAQGERAQRDLLFLRDNGLWEYVFEKVAISYDHTAKRICFQYCPVALSSQQVPLGCYIYGKDVAYEIPPLSYHSPCSSFSSQNTSDSWSLLLPYPEAAMAVSNKNVQIEKRMFDSAQRDFEIVRLRSMFFATVYEGTLWLTALGVMAAVGFIVYISLMRSERMRRYRFLKERKRRYLCLQSEIGYLRHAQEMDWRRAVGVFKGIFSDMFPLSYTLEEMAIQPAITKNSAYQQSLMLLRENAYRERCEIDRHQYLECINALGAVLQERMQKCDQDGFVNEIEKSMN